MLKLEWLKENCEKIHWFGLGFIQIKIQEGLRYHFYTDKFPSVCKESIHTHRYTFTSEVIAGKLRQCIFSEVAGNDYKRVLHLCIKGQEPIQAGLFSLNLLTSVNLNKGSHYTIGKDTIHNVSSYGDCITKVWWEGSKQGDCLVYTPYGETDNDPFVDNILEEELWDEVERMLDEHLN